MTFVTEECATCRAPIIMALTRNGKRMPVDAEPHRQGDIQLTARPDDSGELPLAEVLPVAKRFGKTQLRQSHFVTCPHADRWRTPRRTARRSP